MSSKQRQDRLRADLKSIQKLDRVSSVLETEFEGEAPDAYEFRFHGKGIRQSNDAERTIEFVSLHRVEVRIPFSYPGQPPNVRWLTPIFHPNVSFSGFIDLEEIGLPWSEDIFLDAICERLWDVARGAYVNYENATNYTAKDWYEQRDTGAEPFDHRALRDEALKNQATPERSNIIRYRRRRPASDRIEIAGEVHEDVYYIGEETPTPQIPRPLQQPGDDIFYIGDDP